jgi:tetratricopeptide (TPR) repeat protein
MSLKKKMSAGKTATKPAVKRIARQKPVVVLKVGREAKKSAGQSVSSKSAAAAAPRPIHPPNQLAAFEAAVKLFHARKFRQAREQFRGAINGLDRAIADKAELHIRMCDRRLETQAVILKTPEEHYNYAIMLINSRELGTARQHLQKALAQEPDADHVYYALAVCCGLSGDRQGAYENLKRAINIEPKNRVRARQDADFTAISQQPPLDGLLFPERKTPY